MKTLFLLGILGALVVIAFKKPDQTAWDAAREIRNKVENTFLGLEQTAVKTHAEISIQKALDKAKETLQNPDTILSSRQDKEPLFEIEIVHRKVTFDSFHELSFRKISRNVI